MSPPAPRTVQATDKSFPASAIGRPVTDLGLGLRDLSTPLLVLDDAAIDHNLQVMEAWTQERGLELMPHGKTTMAPVLWRRQLAAGCTGITVATGWQADVALRADIPTVQLANACTDPALLRRLVAHLAAHPEQELVLWADSVATIDLLEQVLPDDSRLGVLVELGADGGRTGARTLEQALEVAERAAASSTLVLRGAAGYEGALGHDRSESALQAVGAYCSRLAELAEQLRPLVEGVPWATAGGSAYPDLVAEALAPLQGMRRILRSGAYLVHDSGFYQGISPLDVERGIAPDQALRPAMRAYARVVSRPEPGLALLDAGKRDVPFDEGLPRPLARAAALGGEELPLPQAEITALNDQHAFLRWEGEDGPAVGEVVVLGLSHPCTAFDKWRLVPLLDPATGAVDEAVETFF
ncbi:hypothetical protein ACT3SP_09915 [Brachybacterium sp. AOP43-C2-M15]|uniref:hypothetical protein n=1 Tax=Brachybacterium sp. AOP43-C2-M15 TaxID=3457661 RepID=UPI004034AD5D